MWTNVKSFKLMFPTSDYRALLPFFRKCYAQHSRTCPIYVHIKLLYQNISKWLSLSFYRSFIQGNKRRDNMGQYRYGNYHSYLDNDSPLLHYARKMHPEERVLHHGMSSSSVRPSFYSQILVINSNLLTKLC